MSVMTYDCELATAELPPILVRTDLWDPGAEPLPVLAPVVELVVKAVTNEASAAGMTTVDIPEQFAGPDESEGPNEAELIKLAKKGDISALNALFAMHYPSVLSHAAAMQPVDDDPEDVAQYAFMKLLERIAKFEDEGNGVGPYLSRTVTNRVYDLHKSKRNKLTVRTEQFWESAADQTTPIEDAISGNEAYRILEQLKAKLLPEQYELFVTYYLVGRNQKECAEDLGIKVGALKSRLFRIREVTQKLFEDYEDFSKA